MRPAEHSLRVTIAALEVAKQASCSSGAAVALMELRAADSLVATLEDIADAVNDGVIRFEPV